MGGPGVDKTAAPKAGRPTEVAAPQKGVAFKQDPGNEKIFVDFKKAGGRDIDGPGAFLGRLEKVLTDQKGDAKVSRDEFEEITGVEMSRAAWRAFAGKDGALTLGELQGRMDKYAKFAQVANQSIEYFGQADRIEYVSEAAMDRGLRSWPKSDWDYYLNPKFNKEGQGGAKDLMRRVKEEQYTGGDVTYEEIMKLSEEELYLFGTGMMMKYRAAAKKADVDLPKGLENTLEGLVFVRGELRDMFGVPKDGYTGIKEESLEKLEEFCDLVGGIRSSLGAEAVKPLDQIDPSSFPEGELEASLREIAKLARTSPTLAQAAIAELKTRSDDLAAKAKAAKNDEGTKAAVPVEPAGPISVVHPSGISFTINGRPKMTPPPM